MVAVITAWIITVFLADTRTSLPFLCRLPLSIRSNPHIRHHSLYEDHQVVYWGAPLLHFFLCRTIHVCLKKNTEFLLKFLPIIMAPNCPSRKKKSGIVYLSNEFGRNRINLPHFLKQDENMQTSHRGRASVSGRLAMMACPQVAKLQRQTWWSRVQFMIHMELTSSPERASLFTAAVWGSSRSRKHADAVTPHHV